MMRINENKLEDFQRSIEKQAQARLHQIEEEIESYRQEQMKKAKDEVQFDADKIIQKEISKSSITTSMESAKKTAEYRKALLMKRDEYADSIFQEARNRLSEFAASSDYESFLTAKAEKLGASVPFDDSVIQIRPADQKFSELIQKAYGHPCTIEQNESIALGGMMLQNNKQGIIVDETLDSALEEQKEWFRNNSGFLVARM